LNLYRLFQIVITMSFTGSVVAGIIFLTKALLKDRLNATWHYYIWFLLVIRLVVPYAPQSSFSIFNLVSTNTLNNIDTYGEPDKTGANSSSKDILSMENIEETKVSLSRQAKAKNSELEYIDSFKNTGIRYLYLLWVTGVLVVLLYNLLVYIALQKKIKNMPRCTDYEIINILERCRRRVQVKKIPGIICCTGSKGPSLIGHFKPKIIVSPDVLRSLSYEDLEHIFLHELMHIKRRDILENWLMIIVQSLHWFNPIVWYAFSKMRKDREIICDAQVLTLLEPERRKNYGNTIISLVEILSSNYWRPGIVGMAKNKSEIKRRIIMIKKFNKTSLSWTIIITAIVVLIGAISLTNAKGLANPPSSNDDSNDLPPAQVVHEEETNDENKIEDDNNEATESDEDLITEETQAQVNIPNNFPQQPQVLVEVDMEIVENDQKQVDEGHSPWQLSPFAVTQTFVGLQMYPDGIEGDFPVDMEDMKIIHETNDEVIVEIDKDESPISRVYLKRLVRQDEDGIWTVIGYDLKE
jgi:beta-lactamase regulating signal transducer with metallopeptidase domain